MACQYILCPQGTDAYLNKCFRSVLEVLLCREDAIGLELLRWRSTVFASIGRAIIQT